VGGGGECALLLSGGQGLNQAASVFIRGCPQTVFWFYGWLYIVYLQYQSLANNPRDGQKTVQRPFMLPAL